MLIDRPEELKPYMYITVASFPDLPWMVRRSGNETNVSGYDYKLFCVRMIYAMIMRGLIKVLASASLEQL